MNKITKTGLLLALSLGLVLGSLPLPTASAALTGTWVPSVRSVVTTVPSKSFSKVIGAVAKFEGTLKAYSVSEEQNLKEQVFLASDGISASLESLNAELKEIYPDLTKEQQQAIAQAYLSVGSYLEKLAEEANQVFQDEGRSAATFEVEKIGEIAPNLANQLWVGSATSI